MPVLVIIPARYASTRYPGKPLEPLRGAMGDSKSLIRRTWEAAQQIAGVDRVVVATDDDRIKEAAEAFGSEVVMTTSDARNGTERCADALRVTGDDYDVVVNLQGDSPLTPPWFVENLVDGLRGDPAAHLATPVLRCEGATLNELLVDRSEGRVGGTTAVFGADAHALYFSKEVIPFTSETYSEEEVTPVYHHVGVYAYRPDVLREYAAWPMGPLETLEGLEQLRFLEQNRRVLCVEVDGKGRKFWELNNPEDVPRVEKILADLNIP